MRLKQDDAAALISQTASKDSVIVGGQAVAFWSTFFGIQPRLPSLTEDIDYLATSAEAKRASARVTFRHVLRIATLDDATPNTAILSVYLPGHKDPIVIDYLSMIEGVDSKQVEQTAVSIEYLGQPIKVIHPLSLLRSKISNLYKFDKKRSPEGIEQARLAIEIASAFVETIVQSAVPKRDLLNAVQSIARFAATNPARYAMEHYGLDCFDGIARSALVPGVLPALFHEKQWPRLVAAAGRKKKKTPAPRCPDFARQTPSFRALDSKPKKARQKCRAFFFPQSGNSQFGETSHPAPLPDRKRAPSCASPATTHHRRTRTRFFRGLPGSSF